jgi:hypothetical protein
MNLPPKLFKIGDTWIDLDHIQAIRDPEFGYHCSDDYRSRFTTPDFIILKVVLVISGELKIHVQFSKDMDKSFDEEQKEAFNKLLSAWYDKNNIT